MLRIAIVLLLSPSILFSQATDQHFQVLVSKNAKVFGSDLEPLSYVDDVTSINIADDGFVALVHKQGTTFELKEKTFTFYLKPDKSKQLDSPPELEILYKDLAITDPTEMIEVVYPLFDENGITKLAKGDEIELFWHMPDEPVINYKISVMDHNGKKIQDFGTKHHRFTLKPYNLGLAENELMFQISSTFAGNTVLSKKYHIELIEPKLKKPIKAADLILKALELELTPVYALEVWEQIQGMENGAEYSELYQKFLNRNKLILTKSGKDVELLLSQNK